MKEKITKLKEKLESKYEQFLAWLILRATEILNQRLGSRFKPEESIYQKLQNVLDARFKREIIPKNKDESDSYFKRLIEDRKKKLESLPRDKNNHPKIQYGATEKKTVPLSITFPCEKLWSAVFGEQTSLTLEEYKSKKEILFFEIEKMFNECKTKNEVNDVYNDLAFKNRFINKFDKATKLSLVLVDYLLEEQNIKQKIEEVNLNRLVFLKENTKIENIKVCSCQTDCFCLQAQRTTLTENGQEIVLFDNVEEMKKTCRDYPNYESLGLEIEEYKTGKEPKFSIFEDEKLIYLNMFGRQERDFNLERREGINEIQISFYLLNLKLETLEHEKNEIEKQYDKSWIKYSALILNVDTGKTNLVYIIKKPKFSFYDSLKEKVEKISSVKDVFDKYHQTWNKEIPQVSLFEEKTSAEQLKDFEEFQDFIDFSSKNYRSKITSCDSAHLAEKEIDTGITYSFNKKINEITSDDLKTTKEHLYSESSKLNNE